MSPGVTRHDDLQTRLNATLTAWAKRYGEHMVLGLSGGGDSMALALGCARWMTTNTCTVHAVCVDHGLRAGSGEEAQQTLAWALALGLSAKAVSLNMPLTPARLQERARQARHEALLASAKAHGARIILMAHNQDDQHETVALRLTSQTGLDGLSGMRALAPSPFYQDDWPCLLGRPLLNDNRQALRHMLMATGQEWHDDPSNINAVFARVRARARLADLKAKGADTQMLGRIAAHAGALRSAGDGEAHDMLKTAGLEMSEGKATLSLPVLARAPQFMQLRALGWLAFAIGGAQRQPDFSKISRLCAALHETPFRGATLSGAKFICHGEHLIVTAAPLRKGLKSASLRPPHDAQLRLHAISGNIDQFVTYLA